MGRKRLLPVSSTAQSSRLVVAANTQRLYRQRGFVARPFGLASVTWSKGAIRITSAFSGHERGPPAIHIVIL